MSSLPSLDKMAGKYSERWGHLSTLIERVDLTNATAKEDIPDRCKSLCESILKDILVISKEKTDVEVAAIRNMSDLAALTRSVLGFETQEDALVSSEIRYLNELRNDLTTGGHGQGGRRHVELINSVDTDKIQRILAVTDALLFSLITQCQRQFPQEIEDAIIRNKSFDDYLDSNFNSVTIGQEEYFASDILYNLNPEGYKEGLSDFIKEVYEQADAIENNP